MTEAYGIFERPASKEAQDQVLIRLAHQAELFHDSDKTAYVDLTLNGHRETYPVQSNDFRQWLRRGYYKLKNGTPNSEAMKVALETIEAQAQFERPTRSVHVRVGAVDGKIYLDLADPLWRAVEIDSDGWRVIEKPPIRFRRPPGMLTLPEPVRGGSIDALRPFLNLRADADFVLAVAWLFASLRPTGPYPVLVLSGEAGSAKSTAVQTLRSIIDPNMAPLPGLPRDERDLFIAANSKHIVSYDNLSGVRNSLSDSLCRLATGGSFSTRRLYSDGDEFLISVVRPVILAGIDDFVLRGDLARIIHQVA